MSDEPPREINCRCVAPYFPPDRVGLVQYPPLWWLGIAQAIDVGLMLSVAHNVKRDLSILRN